VSTEGPWALARGPFLHPGSDILEPDGADGL